MRSYLKFLFALVLGMFYAAADINAQQVSQAKEPAHRLVIAPLMGVSHSELKSAHSANVTDTQPEYGLFTLYQDQHLTINNMLFLTNVDSSDVSGDLFFANLYGDPKSEWTWNLGAGYLWHEIRSSANNIVIHVPMVKVGVVRRFKRVPLSLNPYIGYSWESVDTTRGDSRSEAWLYGLSTTWHWRRLNVAASYYLEDKVDTHDHYNVARLRGIFFLNDAVGIMARIEYMEHATIDNTSVLFGPAFVL